MCIGAGRLDGLTVGADSKMTNSGKFLREYKVDELARLILRGTMSLVDSTRNLCVYVVV